MLLIGSEQMIQGVSVYADSDHFHKFYLVGGQPGYRRDSQGRPQLSLFKYRFPVDREDGSTGGGFLLLDVAFQVTPEQEQACRDVLQPQVNARAQAEGITQPPQVEFGTIRYLEGSCNLIIAEAGGALVEKVSGSGKPSLFGENSATFGVELTPDGARFFEQALQSAGPVIGIEYDLKATGKLPPITARSHFHSFKFYSFFQEVDTTWRRWREDERDERVHEFMTSTESIEMEFEWGELEDEDAQAEIRNWVFDTTTEAVNRNMIEAIAPVPEDKREIPKNIEDVTRNITDIRISDFTLEFTEARPVTWELRPNGSLPAFSSLRDNDGNAMNAADFIREVDLTDPFLQQVRVNVIANADFAELPLHSIEVKLGYKGSPMPNLAPGEPEGETVLMDPSTIGKFAAFVQDEDYNYEYSYQVNYKNESRSFNSGPIITDDGNLTVNVGDTGILDVEIGVGDINWTEVSRALVTFRYSDSGVTPIEHQISLTEQNTTHRITEVIFEPMRQNYTHQTKYFMKDGSEFTGAVLEGRSPNLFINDVFAQTRTVTVNGLSDFVNKVANIFVDLTYEDAANNYRQTQSVVLNGSTPFQTWSFPVIDGLGGELSYSGTVARKDGTTQTIERQVAEGDMILVPRAPEAIKRIEVIPDLIDWSTTRLARVTLAYLDEANDHTQTASYTFNPNKTAMQIWEVPLMDASKTTYSFEWTLFMADGSRVEKPATETTEDAVVIDPFSV